MIREMKRTDIAECTEILRLVYNNELWQCRWDEKRSTEYLTDYIDSKSFVGYVYEEEYKISGAIFAHEKIWWNNNEIFIDEMFVRPELQGNGRGSALLKKMEEYILRKKLAGFTLTTNKYTPAPKFYEKHGFITCTHVLFMAKEIASE